MRKQQPAISSIYIFYTHPFDKFMRVSGSIENKCEPHSGLLFNVCMLSPEATPARSILSGQTLSVISQISSNLSSVATNRFKICYTRSYRL